MVMPPNISQHLSIQGGSSLLHQVWLQGGQDEDMPMSHGKAGAVPEPDPVVGRDTQSVLGP